MTLEDWQKITDIAVKGVAAAALADGTLWLAAERLNTDKSTLCTESIEKAYAMVSSKEFSHDLQIRLCSTTALKRMKQSVQNLRTG